MSSNAYTEPHWDRIALLTIDVQVDTLGGGLLEVPGTAAALPAIARAAAAARRTSRPIVHVVRLYRRDGSNVDPCRRAEVEAGWHPLAPGARGSEIAPDILPAPTPWLDPEHLLAGRIQRLRDREWVIYKPRWGAFHRTPLDAHLRRLRVDTIAFAGCNFPNCPRASIYEASERDYRVVVLTDAVSRLDARGLDELAAIGATLCTAEGFARTLETYDGRHTR